MAIKRIEYNVNIAGITPATEQFGGMQGDHKVTMIEFVTDDLLNDEITDYAEAINGKAMYRFDVYDGEGGIWSSEPKELEDYTLSMELEERHTRYGGKVTIYLVFTVLSSDCETEIELYSFPAVLRLKNRPEGTYQDGENYESVTSLAEVAKSNALAAEKTNKELQAFAAQIEEKLKNGDFDGVGVESSVIINDELIITYTDGTVQNLGNVKGDTGPQGEKGEKGDAGKDAVTDQTYNPESSNAASGKAVAEAVNGRMPKPTVLVDAPIKTVSVMGHQDYTTITDPDTTINEYIANDSAFIDVIVDDGTVWSKENVEAANGCIPTRDNSGNLWTGTPVDDADCINKKYVDDLVGDIDSALTELHNYAQALIGGNS